jgi:ABC-type sugar transport system substrate-binding protein
MAAHDPPREPEPGIRHASQIAVAAGSRRPGTDTTEKEERAVARLTSGRARRLYATAAAGAAALAMVATATGSAASPVAHSAASLQAIKQQIQKLMKPATSIGVTQPLTKKPTGKLLIYIECDSPICVAASDGYKAAATAIGMKYQAIPTGATPSTTRSAFDQAVAAKPAVLVEGAIAPQPVKAQLEQLVHAGTKVILYATAPPNPPGITAVVYPPSDFGRIGTQMADFIYADHGGKPSNVLFVEDPEFPALLYTVTAFKAEMAKICTKCTTNLLNVNVTEIGKTIPSMVVSYLQRNPDTQYVVSQFGDLELGVPQAIQGAGISSVKLITTEGSSVNLQYVKNGSEYADLINYLPVTYWQLVDLAARALAGQKFTVPPVPEEWITKANLNFPTTASPPFGTNYQKAFEKLWNGKG